MTTKGNKPLLQSVAVAKTGPHVRIPRSIVERAKNHLDTCVCLGSARDAASDLDAFLEE